jgi:hypothetical protein
MVLVAVQGDDGRCVFANADGKPESSIWPLAALVEVTFFEQDFAGKKVVWEFRSDGTRERLSESAGIPVETKIWGDPALFGTDGVFVRLPPDDPLASLSQLHECRSN